MAGVVLDIKGLDAVRLHFEKITATIQDQIMQEILAFALNVVNDAKMNAPVDEGFLRNSIAFEEDNLSVTIIVACNYAAYLEFGTRAFAAAYVSSLPAEWSEYAAQFKGGGGMGSDFMTRIMEWVQRKGIDAKAAYPIALKILREGVRPHPFFVPAVEKNKIMLENNLKALLQ
jgi:HK97 gp10 family phage protein